MDPDLTTIPDDELDLADEAQLNEYLRRALAGAPPAPNMFETHGTGTAAGRAQAAQGTDPRAQAISDQAIAQLQAGLGGQGPGIAELLAGGFAMPPGAADAMPPLSEEELEAQSWPATGAPRMRR